MLSTVQSSIRISQHSKKDQVQIDNLDIYSSYNYGKNIENPHDIQDGLCAQNSMFDIGQHQQSTIIAVDCRYIAGPHFQPVSNHVPLTSL